MIKKLIFAFIFTLSIYSGFAQSTLLQNGPMIGHADMLEVTLWAQTTKSANIYATYYEVDKPKITYNTPTVNTSLEHAFTAHLKANKVQPSKSYNYFLVINNKKASEVFTFKSQALWKFRTDAPNVRIALGSCSYINDSLYDRPGKPYGGEYKIFESIAAQKPDIMLWGGDNIYLRESDWGSKTGIDYRYTHTRHTPEMQKLLANSVNYAIWDDHDFGPNDSDRGFYNKELTLQAFKDFWANPNYGLGGTEGITGTAIYGDVQLFFLDDRWYKTPNNRTTGTQELLGYAQINWLIDALKYSDATFKIIVIGGQSLNSEAVFENYANYAEELKSFQDLLLKEEIKGLFFISGDRHHTELSLMPRTGAYPLYDLTVSPLTSSAGRNVEKERNLYRVEGTLIQERNFAVLDITGKNKARTLNITIMNNDGKELWKRSILETELK